MSSVYEIGKTSNEKTISAKKKERKTEDWFKDFAAVRNFENGLPAVRSLD